VNPGSFSTTHDDVWFRSGGVASVRNSFPAAHQSRSLRDHKLQRSPKKYFDHHMRSGRPCNRVRFSGDRASTQILPRRGVDIGLDECGGQRDLGTTDLNTEDEVLLRRRAPSFLRLGNGGSQCGSLRDPALGVRVTGAGPKETTRALYSSRDACGPRLA
jgi:hypothetical protein